MYLLRWKQIYFQWRKLYPSFEDRILTELEMCRRLSLLFWQWKWKWKQHSFEAYILVIKSSVCFGTWRDISAFPHCVVEALLSVLLWTLHSFCFVKSVFTWRVLCPTSCSVSALSTVTRGIASYGSRCKCKFTKWKKTYEEVGKAKLY